MSLTNLTHLIIQRALNRSGEFNAARLEATLLLASVIGPFLDDCDSLLLPPLFDGTEVFAADAVLAVAFLRLVRAVVPWLQVNAQWVDGAVSFASASLADAADSFSRHGSSDR